MKQLTIISHTEHYTNTDGILVGFGPTVTEINHLLKLFDKIVHVAVWYDTKAPASALPYASAAIQFVALPAVGGKTLSRKSQVIWQAPGILKIIKQSVKESTHVQFRAPTGMGVYVIPYVMGLTAKQVWFKYAGNWKQEKAPLAYQWQRWLLKNQKRKVTINGTWADQPSHCLSFENPCITEPELQDGASVRREKVLPESGIALCFVGRLETAKGIDMFLESLEALSEADKAKLGTVHIVGEMKEGYSEADLMVSGVSLKYHGTLARKALHSIYKQSHFIVLPSRSEGFPKVISEALNFGCVPVVSNVSAIGQYIKNGEQGILIEMLTTAGVKTKLRQCLSLSPESFKKMISREAHVYNRFSYEYYNQRIWKEVLNNS
ncbi:glycosyltransferase family 4 protein [Aestuariibaculum suncheonense]|uniref:Glycosyltransferase n=1 Tax=Aestuariibaculum suncheonense TaxID=1028745 RepID=A0A8J6UEE8_9FLAO|nr:glycosyltransferase family 4 protein [Aestuariibaculum suncheonense]MBD0837002.1 glycosyltransferase [Aestuariibaculum suncheonense]